MRSSLPGHYFLNNEEMWVEIKKRSAEAYHTDGQVVSATAVFPDVGPLCESGKHSHGAGGQGTLVRCI